MFLIELTTGLALITFGVRFLRKGLDRLFGGKLLALLERASRNRLQALCAGIVTGAAAPSSTGLSLLIAQILGSGKIGTDRLLAILLGANIGMTVLANIAALELGNYAGILLFFGVIGFQFVKKERIRGIGQCLLSLGFIFLAMTFLKEGAKAFSASQDVNTVFGVLDRHPFILCIAALTSAVLLQSSTATVGLGIGLAAGGALPAPLFIIWIIGTNLGLGLTSLLVSCGTLEGRRLGAANLFAKIVVALLLVAITPLKGLATPASPLPVGQQLALMHTAFNVVVALIALPLLHWLLMLVKLTVVSTQPAAQQLAQVPCSFLNPQALESASIALAHATREALRMTDEVRNMLQNLWNAYLLRKPDQIKLVRAHDDLVDEMHRELMLFLSQIGDMSDFDRRWHLILMTYSTELETVGDIIDKNLSATMLRQLSEDISLNSEDSEIIGHLYQKIILQFEMVAGLVTTRDDSTAGRMVSAKEDISAWCIEQKKLHYERLKLADKHTVATSLSFFDILDGLRRVSDHLSAIAFGLTPGANRPKKHRSKSSPKQPGSDHHSPSSAGTTPPSQPQSVAQVPEKPGKPAGPSGEAK